MRFSQNNGGIQKGIVSFALLEPRTDTNAKVSFFDSIGFSRCIERVLVDLAYGERAVDDDADLALGNAQLP